MALTPSTMPELGQPMPAFALPDFDGNTTRSDDFPDAKALLVAFWCNHCPYVQHIRHAFADFAREYRDKGLAVIAINANDSATHPADGPEAMKKAAADFHYSFPYLIDENQHVAKDFKAACTPDFFLYDAERKLVYRGQFDASRPGNDITVTGEQMRAACDAVLAGNAVTVNQEPAIGCNIKWKRGNEPAW